MTNPNTLPGRVARTGLILAAAGALLAGCTGESAPHNTSGRDGGHAAPAPEASAAQNVCLADSPKSLANRKAFPLYNGKTGYSDTDYTHNLSITNDLIKDILQPGMTPAEDVFYANARVAVEETKVLGKQQNSDATHLGITGAIGEINTAFAPEELESTIARTVGVVALELDVPVMYSPEPVYRGYSPDLMQLQLVSTSREAMIAGTAEPCAA